MLRAANVLFHALAAAFAGALAHALGLGRLGALVATAWAVTFPHLGGTAHWVVGRVDSQCLPLVLACGWAALTDRPRAAGLCALAALATKESGIVAPAVATVLCLATEGRTSAGGGRACWRRVRWAWAAAGVGLVLRRLALGVWVGGYASAEEAVGAGARDLSLSLPWRDLGAALGPPTLAAVAVVPLAGLGLGLGRPRVVLAALAAAVGSLVPLLPLLSSGAFEPVHFRWLLAPDVYLGLAVAAGLAGGASRSAARRGLLGLLALAAVAARVPEARADFERWAAAGEQAAAVEAAARRGLSGRAPSPDPVLIATAPRLSADHAAYVLHWGVADRFRPPFEPAPRPVWPWRPLFNALERDRTPATLPVDGLRLPFGEGRPTVPEIGLTVYDGGRALDRDEPLALDLRVLEARLAQRDTPVEFERVHHLRLHP